MNRVNFEAENKNKRTIFQACFNIYLANSENENLSYLKLRLESVFLHLLDKASTSLDSDTLKKVLEKPDRLGKTVAFQASQFSEKILSKLCEQKLSMKQITANFEVIEFNFPALTSRMIKLGVNPRIYNLFGKNQHQLLIKKHSKNEKILTQSLMNAKSIYFSMEDENCDENCVNPCQFAFSRYVVQNGILIDPFKARRVGAGSSGSVYEGFWHSKPAAFKLIPISFYKSESESIKSFSDLLENISEFIHQRSIEGPGVLKPLGFYRQQIQKRKTLGHFNVIAYPLCDCNLHELLEQQSFNEFQIGCILSQCLIRKV